jgi:hypothetical protein
MSGIIRMDQANGYVTKFVTCKHCGHTYQKLVKPPRPRRTARRKK